MTQFGRPTLSPEQVDDIFRKLEPYLKTGLTVNKACLEAQIPKPTVYDLCNEDTKFAERIDASRNYCAVMLNNIVMIELTRIYAQGGLPLTANDIKFVQWFATHSLLNRDEFKEPVKDDKLEKSEYHSMSDDELRDWFDDLLAKSIETAQTQHIQSQSATQVAESTTPPA